MIKEIPKYERPREKLLLNGVKSLSNNELLAIIIKSGTKGKSALEISNEILHNINKLKDLKDIELMELKKIKGLGSVKAMEIIASIELGYRIINDKTSNKQYTSSKELYEEFKFMLDKKVETFIALYFDSKCHLISYKELFMGDYTLISPKPNEIFKYALKSSASGVVVMHNHPSGDPTPSISDMEFTSNLSKIAELMNVLLLDHIIVGNTYYSFQEEGML